MWHELATNLSLLIRRLDLARQLGRGVFLQRLVGEASQLHRGLDLVGLGWEAGFLGPKGAGEPQGFLKAELEDRKRPLVLAIVLGPKSDPTHAQGSLGRGRDAQRDASGETGDNTPFLWDSVALGQQIQSRALQHPVTHRTSRLLALLAAAVDGVREQMGQWAQRVARRYPELPAGIFFAV